MTFLGGQPLPPIPDWYFSPPTGNGIRYDGSTYFNSGPLHPADADRGHTLTRTFTKTGTFSYVDVGHPGQPTSQAAADALAARRLATDPLDDTSGPAEPRPAPLSRIYGHELGLQPMAGAPPGVAAFQTYPTLFLSAGQCPAPTSTPGRRA